MNGASHHPDTSGEPAEAVDADSRGASRRSFADGAVVSARYRIDAYLDEGGMGQVYRAHDLDLDVPLALKTIQPQIASNPTSLRRFKQEILLARSISHPNVCRIFDLWRDEASGVFFLTMELLAGQSLASRIEKEGALSPADSLPLARQMANALDAAHRAGVVHRDFKSANVMLVPTDSGERVVITDFGLAVPVRNGGSNAKAKANSGATSGTTPWPSGQEPPPETQSGSTPQFGRELPPETQSGSTPQLGQEPPPDTIADDATQVMGSPDPESTIELRSSETRPSEPVIEGTPAYMSPEQVMGGTIGPASDLYALGVVLFEMITGRRPFSGPTPIDTARAHVTLQPPNPRALVDVDSRWEETILRLLSKDPAARHATAADAVLALEGRLEPTPLVRHSLPPERDAFVGRRTDIEAISARLEAEDGTGSRLLTLQGTGGTGKTRLALRYAWESVSRWPGGVWFCDLAEVRTADGIAAAVAAALDVGLDGRSPIAHLGNVMAGRGKCLVILDNFEQLVEHADATLGRWIEASALPRFLVTSRERLRLPEETTYALGPLDPETQGAELFAIRAASHRPGFVVDVSNRARVDEIVRHLDGLPLAIELAASRLRMLSLEQLQERLVDRFRILSGGRPGRHQALRTTLDWSWELLRPWERSAMAQLSSFEGGFALEAAEFVVDLSMYDGDPFVLDVIQSLVDKSWLSVRAAGGALRFHAYASVHEYANERAEEYSAENDAQAPRQVEARHGSWFARLGTESLAGTQEPAGPRSRGTVLLELENLLAACRRAIARRDAETAEATYLAAETALSVRGPFGLSAELARQALDLLDSDRSGRTLICLGNAERRAGNMQSAREVYQKALVVARETGDRRLEGSLISHIAVLDASQGRVKEALDGMGASLALARELGNRNVEGNDLGNLGVLFATQGRLDEAQRHYEAALEVHRQSGYREGEAMVLGSLSNLLVDQNRFDEARERCADAIVIARELGNQVQESYALGSLGLIDRMQGHAAAALNQYTVALEIARRSGERRFEGYLLGDLAALHHAQGRTEDALDCCERALAITGAVKNRAGEAAVLVTLGRLLAEQARLDEARAHVQAALTVYRDLGDRTAEGNALVALGDIERRQGRKAEAYRCYRESESILRDGDDRFELGLVLCARGELDAQDHDARAALAALAEAESIAQGLALVTESELVRKTLGLRRVIADTEGFQVL